MSDFLISYASDDKQWADWIAWQLGAAGYSATLQSADPDRGQSLATSVGLALNEAESMIAIISPSYLRSGTSESDFQAALLRGRQRLIPVVVAPTNLPPVLIGLASVDLTGSGELAARELLFRAVPEGQPGSRPEPGGPDLSRTSGADPASGWGPGISFPEETDAPPGKRDPGEPG